jgi:hypothetical protein
MTTTAFQTRILWPEFGDVNLWRNVSRRNEAVGRIGFLIASLHSWLPQILTDAGFFPSNSEVKKNRADLWRDVVDGEVVKLGFALIRFARVTGFVDVESR